MPRSLALLFLAGLLWLPQAFAQGRELNRVFTKDPSKKDRVSVDFALEGDTLVATFDVETSDKPQPKKDPSALYTGDVVELFLNVSGGQTPYLELEVSPYDQELLVRVTGTPPKLKFDGKAKVPGFTHSVQKHAGGWTAVMSIPLKALGWDGEPESLTGNAFAILGGKTDRRYFSLNIEKQDKPSFHKPEFFRPLLQ